MPKVTCVPLPSQRGRIDENDSGRGETAPEHRFLNQRGLRPATGRRKRRRHTGNAAAGNHNIVTFREIVPHRIRSYFTSRANNTPTISSSSSVRLPASVMKSDVTPP